MNEFRQPFISIGITTYNRKHLLRRCLESLIRQTNDDFEVLVGNDYTQEELSADLVGIIDSRVKFINHKENLGERGNLNTLLNLASGKFFTWQFDDDYYATDYIESIYKLTNKNPDLNCVFTSYKKVFDDTYYPTLSHGMADSEELLSGRMFLRYYLDHKIRAMGFTGAYKLEHLKKIGKVEALTQESYAIFSEYLFLFHAAKEIRVGYINRPLVFYYVHDGSWSNVNTELEIYREAGINLIEKSLEAFRHSNLVQDIEHNTKQVVKYIFHEYSKKTAMKPSFQCLRDIQVFFDDHLAIYLAKDKKSTITMRLVLLFTRWKWSIFPIIKSKMKKILPSGVLIKLLRIHARFQ